MRERLAYRRTDLRLLRLQSDLWSCNLNCLGDCARLQSGVGCGCRPTHHDNILVKEGFEPSFFDLNNIGAGVEVDDQVGAHRGGNGCLGHVGIYVRHRYLRVRNCRAALVSYRAVDSANRLRTHFARAEENSQTNGQPSDQAVANWHPVAHTTAQPQNGFHVFPPC